MPNPQAPKGYSTWTEYFEKEEPWKLEYWRYYSGRDNGDTGERTHKAADTDSSNNRAPRPKINCD